MYMGLTWPLSCQAVFTGLHSFWSSSLSSASHSVLSIWHPSGSHSTSLLQTVQGFGQCGLIRELSHTDILSCLSWIERYTLRDVPCITVYKSRKYQSVHQ